jgi:hypothetical protein
MATGAGEMSSRPGNWYLGTGIWGPCFGPQIILCGQNRLTAWYLGRDTSSLVVRIRAAFPTEQHLRLHRCLEAVEAR